MKKSTLKNVALLAFGLLGASVHAQNASIKTTGKADTIAVNKQKNFRPVSFRNRFGTFSGESTGRHNWGVKNQRQYRKMLRSNPHLSRSKKCRTKIK